MERIPGNAEEMKIPPEVDALLSSGFENTAGLPRHLPVTWRPAFLAETVKSARRCFQSDEKLVEFIKALLFSAKDEDVM